MSPADDLVILAQQEALLHFPAFDPATAWQLGNLLHTAVLARCAASPDPLGGTVEIELAGQLLFACATPGAKPNQADWIRRKRNTVHQLHRCTYAIGRELARGSHSREASHGREVSRTLEAAHNLSETDHAAHGGGFPIRLTSAPDTIVGTIVLSGLPQRDDHTVVVTAIAELLGITIPQLA